MIDFDNRDLFTPCTHPRFCCDDRYVVFTTTVLGAVDVTIVPLATLREQTA